MPSRLQGSDLRLSAVDDALDPRPTGRPAESLVDLVARLVAELAGVVPASEVVDCVLRQRAALHRDGVPDERMLSAIEQASRATLSRLVPSGQ